MSAGSRPRGDAQPASSARLPPEAEAIVAPIVLLALLIILGLLAFGALVGVPLWATDGRPGAVVGGSEREGCAA